MDINWKICNIDGFENYLISEYGEIFNIKLNKKVLEQISEGYKCVTLRHINGKRKTFKVHRLVAFAFLGNSNNLEINHKDGNKCNNYYENLEWCTHSHNVKHAWDNKLLRNTKERSYKLSKSLKETSKNKKQLNSNSVKIKCVTTNEVFECMKDALEKYPHVQQASLTRCCQGKYKTAGNLKWSYCE